jgi:purine nucleosidase
MQVVTRYLFSLFFISALFACTKSTQTDPETPSDTPAPAAKIPVLFDTDANNELDDQHAMAYLFFNGDVFDVVGVTVNNTSNGGGIDGQYAEAERVMQLCAVDGRYPLLKGAEGNFTEIRERLNDAEYDGHAAVDFIVAEARKKREKKLVLLPVGKLTNIALALEKAPDIKEKVRIVWLGSNYPKPGEYNQVNDIPSLNYIIEQEVPFEMVMVRYGQPSGSDAVRATPLEITTKMPGKGPQASQEVTGRHGHTFTRFGDYSVSLFENIDLHGDPPSRALFDMVAVAVVKNPAWGEKRSLPAPKLEGENWVEQPENTRQISIWENFDSEAIMADFYDRMSNYQL